MPPDHAIGGRVTFTLPDGTETAGWVGFAPGTLRLEQRVIEQLDGGVIELTLDFSVLPSWVSGCRPAEEPAAQRTDLAIPDLVEELLASVGPLPPARFNAEGGFHDG